MHTWESYRATIGDRSSLFAAIWARWAPERALYAGSYLDLSPSTAIPSVTYVDTDRRADRFFADTEQVNSQLAGRRRPGAGAHVQFLAADYTSGLPLQPDSFDLLVSLYASRAWDSCRHLLRPGGLLLANASHGDASLAALDPHTTLVAAVTGGDDRYTLTVEDLDRFLVPKRPGAADADAIRKGGRGVAYTHPAFAYVFTVR